MIDLCWAVLLCAIAVGVGKRLLDAWHQTPEHSIDTLSLALPLGLGVLSLGTLLLGELGHLNGVGLSLWLALLAEIGLVTLLRWARAMPGRVTIVYHSHRVSSWDLLIAACAVVVLLGTIPVASSPVADGDALCYHLQVPKVFLMHGATTFSPDLHETVYPLVTEMLYAVSLQFRGPVACRWLQWFLGLSFAGLVTALARPTLGRRAWWAGAIAIAVPAISNGMSAPLNDVSLAAFGTAAIVAWVRLQERPTFMAAIVAGVFAGLAIGVKYPALVLVAMLLATIMVRAVAKRGPSLTPAPRWLALALVYALAAVLVGGWWYLRAYVYTGNPVYPFFRQLFSGAGLDEVLDPIKRPLAVNPWNLLMALGALSLEPDRFDSFSHQFGPVFLLFLPILLLERLPRRLWVLVALGYGFLMLCMTQRQSMRFLLIAIGPMSVAVAYGASLWCERKTVPARLLASVLLLGLVFEAGVSVARGRRAWPHILGQESTHARLERIEPTYRVGRWAAASLPPEARLIGQDHRGFYIPRPYTMERAHRRRTGLGQNGESAQEVVESLRHSGFTHVLMCPPVPEDAVEFDPTLGRLLAPWIVTQTPVFREDLVDGDGVSRRYAIYDLEAAPTQLVSGVKASRQR
jgi:hypothetical protein